MKFDPPKKVKRTASSVSMKVHVDKEERQMDPVLQGRPEGSESKGKKEGASKRE